jgi:anti-sigma factor RsiW
MDCSRFQSGLSDFREGKLPEQEHTGFVSHLASCPSCQRLAAGYDELLSLIGREKETEPNPFAATRLLQRIEDEFSGEQRNSHMLWIRLLQPAAIAAALAFGILIGSRTASHNVREDGMMTAGISTNIEFLRSDLFIDEFSEENNILVLNK